MKGRILSAIKRKKEIESTLFSEKELRGLSKVEKEYIRENEYKCYVDIAWPRGTVRCYMFIERDLIGRKRLYAITKKQSIRPNGRDISANAHNYECWLLFTPSITPFSIYFYERRFCRVPEIRMIFV